MAALPETHWLLGTALGHRGRTSVRQLAAASCSCIVLESVMTPMLLLWHSCK